MREGMTLGGDALPSDGEVMDVTFKTTVINGLVKPWRSTGYL